MTDRNGKPLKVGDKVTHQYSLSGKPGVVTAIGESVVLAHFIDASREEVCDPKYLTLIEPKPKPKPPAGVANMHPAMKQLMEYEAAQWEENSHVSPFDRGSSDDVKAMKAAFSTLKSPNPFSVGMFGHIPRATYTPKPEPVGYKWGRSPINLNDLGNNSMFGGIPVVTYEAVPEGEVWLVDTAKITEYLNSEEGRASIKEAFAEADKATAKLADLLMTSPKIDRFATMVEHSGTNVFEALGRDNAAELYAKAELVSRVRDIMGKFERARFPEIADEILKAVADYHEQA